MDVWAAEDQDQEVTASAHHAEPKLLTKEEFPAINEHVLNAGAK